MSDRRAILVIGAGDATGGAIARRFAREGYIACVTRRTADRLQPLVEQIRADGDEAHAFGSDARQEDAMVSLVETIERDIAPIDVAVFNIGANVRFGITETTARVYQKVWEMACFGGFLMGRETAKVMLPRGRSTIIFTAGHRQCAGARGGLLRPPSRRQARARAQSMARERWPKNTTSPTPSSGAARRHRGIRSNLPERYAGGGGTGGHPRPRLRISEERDRPFRHRDRRIRERDRAFR
ncbi:MAG: SDR family NAD(P)-dependent oxidoreductase [Rubrivivax sp.]|nr:SDR family NAD(P)-dependent oxidoreductase [Rubrivivax sp.]